MSRRELAQTLLRKADQDKTAFDKLRHDPEIAVNILGFHAQQAAEKMLKSALAINEIDFPFSHRLTDLFDLLKENGVVCPEGLEELRFLTPFAVAFRYELYEEEEEEPFDSDKVAVLLIELREWTLGNLPAAPQAAPEGPAEVVGEQDREPNEGEVDPDVQIPDGSR